MKDKNDFALVPRAGALEKTKPGEKPILSGMVADTLALAKKGSSVRTRPLRIVIMDDEPYMGEALMMMIQFLFNDAIILTFTDAEAALQEIAREAPDLFTTDLNHSKPSCDEMFRLLAAKQIKYPIFVISAGAEMLANGLGKEWLKKYTDLGLSIILLSKPLTTAELFPLLSKHLGPGDNPQKWLLNGVR